MWDVLRQIARESGFYSKQFGFFMAIFIVGAGGYLAFRQVTSPQSVPQAATQLASRLTPTTDTESALFDIEIAQNSQVTVDGTKVSGALSYEAGKGQFLLVLVRDSSVYIGSMRAVVHLPKTEPQPSALLPRIFAIHGVLAADWAIIDAQTIAFIAQDVPEGATVSIGLTFPENYFDTALLGDASVAASKLSGPAWIILGLGFPFLALVFFIFLLSRRWLANRGIATTAVASAPPDTGPPGVVGALYHARIGPKEITATLFDLADRGFVTLYEGTNDEISFAKGSALFSNQTANLRPFEVFLLHQIFGDGHTVAGQESIRVALDAELFSSKIAMTLVNLYDALVAEGYYIQSPNRYFLRYKLWGIALFFVGAAGALYGSFVLPEPAYILFAWFGMMLAALLGAAIAPGLPTRTARGKKVLGQWLAFRNFLTDRAPVDGREPSQFFAYLPYAIVLDCVDDWVARWRNETIVLPAWFTAAETPYTSDDYKQSLVAVIGYLSQHLITSRPPTLA